MSKISKQIMQDQRQKLTIPQNFWNQVVAMPLFLVFLSFNLIFISNIKVFGKNLWTIFQPEAMIIIGLFELAIVIWMLHLGRITVHRIAGPMVSLKKGLEAMGAGDLTVIVRFRKDDFNKEIADVFCENVEKLRQQVETVKSLADQLAKELPTDHSSQETAQQLLQQLDYFKTEF
ncbi:MAG: hypothetical protein ACRC6M_03905 [Microcystaceae cyanobacterium]